MCVIIIKQEGKIVPDNILENSSIINPDGLGVVWLDSFKVEYFKSEDWELLKTSRPYIAHFRYATVGKVCVENMHPFVCGKNKDEMLMHNGTVVGLGNKDMTDSEHLAINLGDIDRNLWSKELAKHNSRFVTINTASKSFQIYNKDKWVIRNGVWYSKPNVLKEIPVAVYGTLKYGHSNNHYMKNEVHYGYGDTEDKYPLLIEGLPYLVNKKGYGHHVDVDVFMVDKEGLMKLDRLEGHPRWYKREIVPIRMFDNTIMDCWVYFCDKSINGKVLHESYDEPTRKFNYELF